MKGFRRFAPPLLAALATGLILSLAAPGGPAGFFSALSQSALGWNPLTGLWNPRYPGEWLSLSAPLILCSLSVALAARAGRFNLGAEGQYLAGMGAAQLAAFYLPPVSVFQPIAALIMAAGSGMVLGALCAWLREKRGVNEVVAGIIINHLALQALRALSLSMPGADSVATPPFPQTALLDSPILERLSGGSSLGLGLFLAILCAVAFHILVERSVPGLRLRAAGLGRLAARTNGLEPERASFWAMTWAGALAGLAGAISSLDIYGYGRIPDGFDGYGFLGLGAAALGGLTAAGSALSALFFGLLASSRVLLQANGIPRELTLIASGAAIVAVALSNAKRGLHA